MKKIWIPLIAGALVVQSAQAQLLVEHFAYNNGSLGSSGIGDGVWTGGDSPSSSIMVNSSAALTNSSLDGITGSGVIFTGGTFKKKAAPFSAQTSGTVYCSFLLNIQTAPSTVKAFIYLRNGNSATSSPELGIFLNGNSIGLGKKVSTPSASTNLSSGTHFIVARYSFLTGNDQVDLWVDPISMGDNGSVPGATLTSGTTSSSDATTINYIFLNHAASQTLWIDELRVGTNWADVTPTSGGTPIPPAVSNPVITQVFLSSDACVLRGTGGAPAGVYQVLTSTDLSTSVTNWLPLAAYQFDATGNFDCTNPVSPIDLQRFYSIEVGNSNTAPFITSQPQSQTVVEGRAATFQVGVSGCAPLYYQWYFNTNTPLANATNAALILNSVQTSDTGGYSVVVTNSLGAATSAVAMLTVASGGATNLFPLNGAANICVDTPLELTFDSAPTLGTSGQVRIYNASSPGTPADTIDLSLSSQTKTFGGTSLHYYPVLIEGNTAFISLHASLAYGQSYYVTIDNAVFQGVSSWTGVSGTNSWGFTTKAAPPSSDATNIVVAADGSGDFCTVQGAIDSVPSGNTTPRTIRIQNGVYREIVRNNGRNNLTFLGQDRTQTVIIYANNENLNSTSPLRSMFYTLGNDITMKNLKLVNSTPQGGSQAEALKVAGLRFIFWNGELDSLQDTIMVSNDGDQAYFSDSLVQGNVDYVWGSGTAYFNNCEIRSIYRGSSPNGYICQPRNSATNNGLAFVDCQLTGAGGAFNTQYLARNNSKDSAPASQTVYINCMMSTNINPVGWYLDGSSSPANLRFWEYQSTDLTGTNLIDVSQRPSWSRQLTADEAAAVRDLGTWFGGWVPQVGP
ncbi:MAG TPA: pectinesterase family protein [Verrucomicrobiae bacterium]|nr:pectinesterase family protein [Verrucomicrobiae bacterium]